MEKNEAVTNIAKLLEERVGKTADRAKQLLGDRAEVVVKEQNYTLEAQAMLDAALIELAYERVMEKFNFASVSVGPHAPQIPVPPPPPYR